MWDQTFCPGPAHADELQYMFQSLLFPKLNWPTLTRGSADEQFSREFISLWSSFGTLGYHMSLTFQRFKDLYSHLPTNFVSPGNRHLGMALHGMPLTSLMLRQQMISA